MSKLERKIQKVFGDGQPASGNIAVFGSLAAGASGFTKDPDAIQSLPAYAQGWSGATVLNNAAAMQDMNALQFLFSRQLAYLFQSGVPEYHAAQEYHAGSVVRYGDILYISKQDDNTGRALNNTNYWRQFIPISSGPSSDRPPNASTGFLYFDTTINVWITRAQQGWTTVSGSPGDVKAVYLTREQALDRNPGWLIFEHDGKGRAIAMATDNPIAPRPSNRAVGEENIWLSVAQLPAHSHTIGPIQLYGESGKSDVIANGGANRPESNFSGTTNSAGGNQPVSVMQPTLYLWHLFKDF
ncbi:MAG: hypothetical protein LBC18_09570 [Opitutaceae bacterium]|jgi:hypothetical protein|nr:hypothetical protein [Opitutaceae bacterium]